jgi:hypothetical protein
MLFGTYFFNDFVFPTGEPYVNVYFRSPAQVSFCTVILPFFKSAFAYPIKKVSILIG